MAEKAVTGSGEKVAIISVVGVMLIGVIYFIAKKLKPAMGAATAVVNQGDQSGQMVPDAIDADDEKAFEDEVAAMKNSSFSDALAYIAQILPDYMNGGANEADSDSITINGNKVVPKSAAMVGALWTGWSSSVIANDFNRSATTPVIPRSGYTQAQANEAKALLDRVAQIYFTYKTKKLRAIF